MEASDIVKTQNDQGTLRWDIKVGPVVEGWTPAVQDLFLFCIYVPLWVPAQALAAQWFVYLTKNVLNRLKTKTVAEMSLWRGLTEKLFLQSETTGWSAFRCPLPGPCTTSLGPGSTGTGTPTEILHLPCQTCTNMHKFTPIACGYNWFFGFQMHYMNLYKKAWSLLSYGLLQGLYLSKYNVLSWL